MKVDEQFYNKIPWEITLEKKKFISLCFKWRLVLGSAGH